MSLVDHPLTTKVAAGRTNHLMPGTESVDHHDDHSKKPSAQYEPDKPQPSRAKDQEMEHWKSLQCTLNNEQHPIPTQVALQI